MAVFTDSFNGTPGAAIPGTNGWAGSGWVFHTTGTAAARSSTGGTLAIRSTAVSTPDNEASLLLLQRGNSTSVGVCARYTDSSNHYGARVANGGVFGLFKVVGGTITTLIDNVATVADGQRIGCRCVGNQISALVNGVVVATVTDTSLTTGNSGGIRGINSTTPAVVDDYSLSDYTAAIAGSGQLTGDGNLTAAGQPALSGNGALSGDGTLSGAGVPTSGATGGLSGSGTLTGAGATKTVGAAALSGNGTLTGAGTTRAAGPAALSGAGTLAATGTAAPRGAGELFGDGALTAGGRLASGGSGPLAGDGTLSGGSSGFTGAGGISGSGTLSAVGLIRPAGAGTLSGSGALTSVGIGRPAGSGALTGDGVLTVNGHGGDLRDITITWGPLTTRALTGTVTTHTFAGSVRSRTLTGTLEA